MISCCSSSILGYFQINFVELNKVSEKIFKELFFEESVVLRVIHGDISGKIHGGTSEGNPAGISAGRIPE